VSFNREGAPQPPFRTIALLMLLPVLGLFAFVVFRAIYPKETPSIPPQKAMAPQRPAVQSAAVAAAPKPVGSIVLIIDDVGFDAGQADRLMSLDPNINIAVLPNATRAREIARRLHDAGFEILVHLPMEPMGSESPGRNAILTSMPDDEIAAVVADNIRAVPYARGVNNHMGSRATADQRVMSTVLGALPDGMYFVDSRTGERSVGEKLARQMNIRTASRHVFLDDVRTASAIRMQLSTLARLAQERGHAVGIGHPHPVTLDVLAEEIPRLRARGFRFLRASAVVN
jgi:uncharacterized protein